MQLPAPSLDGAMSLEKALQSRRTVRSFSPNPLSLAHFSQMLWAAYGAAGESKHRRTVPSGGALYPMDLYAAVGEGGLAELDGGIYHYEPREHRVSLLASGDFRSQLAKASLHQMWMAGAPVSIVVTVEYRRICGKYGDRGIRYAMMESGHIAQNIFLQAETLGLGAGIVGAFHDEEVSRVMGLPKVHEPLLILPVGYRK